MTIFCGLDVSKSWLDAWIEPVGHQRFANTAEGVAELGAWCRAHYAALVVMEASGGLEQLAYLALWQAGQPCAIANARSVRKFAEAMGYLARTSSRVGHDTPASLPPCSCPDTKIGSVTTSP